MPFGRRLSSPGTVAVSIVVIDEAGGSDGDGGGDVGR